MLRLAESLAKEILKKIKDPEVISSGEKAFTFKNHSSIGLIDPLCAFGTDHRYSLECPVPIIYPELQQTANINGYFLYKREELMVPIGPWNITKLLVDPTTKDGEEQIDVADCSIILASDIDKLTCKTVNTMEQLLKIEPLLIDCLTLGK